MNKFVDRQAFGPMDYLEIAAECGFMHTAVMPASQLKPLPEVRAMCAANRCNRYEHSWRCPPACGSIEHCENQMRQFDSCVVVQTTGEMPDEFDFERIKAIEEEHKAKLRNFVRELRSFGKTILPLSAGTCTICYKCTYPDQPCRYPSRAFSSMEAYGLLVKDVCEQAGLKYNYGAGTMTFTACVLYNQE